MAVFFFSPFAIDLSVCQRFLLLTCDRIKYSGTELTLYEITLFSFFKKNDNKSQLNGVRGIFNSSRGCAVCVLRDIQLQLKEDSSNYKMGKYFAWPKDMCTLNCLSFCGGCYVFPML